MQLNDLIKAGKNQVRVTPDLMSAYIEIFQEKFGRKPDCAGCTFNRDWDRLVKSTNLQNIEIMSDKTFRLKNNARIYSYDFEDKKTKRTLRKRAYGNVMTEEFAENYLTNGTEQQIADRKKEFAILPKKFIEPTEDVVEDISKLTVKKLQELAEQKEFPKEEWEGLKKDELVAYINGKLIDVESDVQIEDVVEE